MSLYDINKALETPTPNPQVTEQAEPPDYERLKSQIPPKYHSFLPLFCESIANKLHPHRPYDHRIPLKEGFEPPFGPLCSLAHHELEACITRMGTRKKRRRKSCHSIYEWEKLASYIPIAKPFLRSHSSAFGGVPLSGSRPAVLRQGAVPVRCHSGEMPFR